MTAPGCRVLRSDTTAAADPRPGLWGEVDCVTGSRSQYVADGGDPNPTAAGEGQGNDAFRKLTAIDGDDIDGERCELGRNDSSAGENSAGRTSGTFALYEQGDHRITFLSERYADGFSPVTDAWQTVMQMKQTQPYDNITFGPVIELQIYDNRLRLHNAWQERWTTAAPARGTWIRYALDVHYSSNPEAGSVQVYADLNGDGDALDAGERSPLIHMPTLITETDGQNGTADGVAAGHPIPDHLRVGYYGNPEIPCPPPSGCSVEVDNVQVTGPTDALR